MVLTMNQKPGKEEKMADWQKCPVCGSPAKTNLRERSREGNAVFKLTINCIRCGNFSIEESIVDFMLRFPEPAECDFGFNAEKSANASAWIFNRKQEGMSTFSINDIEKLRSLPTPTFKEKTERFLLYIADKNPIPGQSIGFNRSEVTDVLNIMAQTRIDEVERKKEIIKKHAELIAHVSFTDSSEFTFLFTKYFQIAKKYLSDPEVPSITPAGWEYIEQLRARNPKSKKAFVAMWFDDNLRSVYEEYISEAVKSCGFKAERVDYVEHNDLIIDKILSSINSSRFVIADFTGNRAGVYYEAGYARGLNIPVIYTCNNSWFNANHSTTITVPIDSSSQSVEVEASFGTQIHFDLLQQNFLLWENGEDLKEKLINRINATINRPDQI
jgi:nucleoside 2-deoxyribosyltransferase